MKKLLVNLLALAALSAAGSVGHSVTQHPLRGAVHPW